MVWPRGFAAAGTSLDARTDRDVGTSLKRMFFLSFFIHLLTGYLLEFNKVAQGNKLIVSFVVKEGATERKIVNMVDRVWWYFGASSGHLPSTQKLTIETRKASVKFGGSVSEEELEVEIEFHVSVKIMTYHGERGMRTEIEETLDEGESKGEHACLEAS